MAVLPATHSPRTGPGSPAAMRPTAARVRRRRAASPAGDEATARRDMTSLPAPIWGFSSAPWATRRPSGARADQCRVVVPRSMASSRGLPVAGQGAASSATRVRRGAAPAGRVKAMPPSGGTPVSFGCGGAWRHSSRQPSASSASEKWAVSAGRGAGVPRVKRAAQRPQRPRPEHSAGGSTWPLIHTSWARVVAGTAASPSRPPRPAGRGRRASGASAPAGVPAMRAAGRGGDFSGDWGDMRLPGMVPGMASCLQLPQDAAYGKGPRPSGPGAPDTPGLAFCGRGT